MSGEHRTRVGHTKADSTDEYAGRGPGGRHIHTTDEIGDRGWLGNPYALDDGYSRSESIEKFRDDFEHRLEHDEEFRGAVRELAGKTLGCWCQRLENDQPACHAEVIAEHANRLAEEQPAVTDGGTPAEEDYQQRQENYLAIMAFLFTLAFAVLIVVTNL